MPLIYPVDRPYRLDETEPSAPSGGLQLKRRKSDLLDLGFIVSWQPATPKTNPIQKGLYHRFSERREWAEDV